MSKPNKPFCLEYDEAESKIFSAVNEAANVNKIPFYLLEGILTNLLHQVRENAKTEKANALSLYDKQMAEFIKEQKTEEEGVTQE